MPLGPAFVVRGGGVIVFGFRRARLSCVWGECAQIVALAALHLSRNTLNTHACTQQVVVVCVRTELSVTSPHTR